MTTRDQGDRLVDFGRRCVAVRPGLVVPPLRMRDRLPDDRRTRALRIRAHRMRVAADDPGREPTLCWGCGVMAPRGSNIGKFGWFTRRIRLATGKAIEVQCPACYQRWGFIEPRKGA